MDSREKKPEQRSYAPYQGTALELRAAEGESGRKIGGYAAKYNTPVLIEDRYGDAYLEELAEGCFNSSLSTCKEEKKEIKALWNHDTGKPLGSTKTDTLRFVTNSAGLEYEIDLPCNTWGDDALESVKRGDVDGSSFGFICLEDKWSKVQHEGKETYKRSIIKAELHEVSPCTFPAYDSSEISCRSFEKMKEDAITEERLEMLKEEFRLYEIEEELKKGKGEK